jgi:hypothetical protein
MNALPTDIYRKIFKDYVYLEVIHELKQYHHSQKLNLALAEMIRECFEYPGAFDEYLVNNDGVFVRPEPGWFGGSRLYFIRMDPEDSVRLQSRHRSFLFEIIPTRETQQLLDDFRRFVSTRMSYEAFFQLKKYYEIHLTVDDCPPVRILTFEKSNPDIVCDKISTKDEYKHVKLPKRIFY